MEVIKLLKKLTFLRSSAAYKGKTFIISSLLNTLSSATFFPFAIGATKGPLYSSNTFKCLIFFLLIVM